jgi:diacylglycerol kinase family enzyme
VLKVAPRTWDPLSHLSDGCIDVIIVPHLSRADALGVATSFASGRLFKDSHVVFVKATRFSMESMGGHIPVNIDGEPVQVRASRPAFILLALLVAMAFVYAITVDESHRLLRFK